MAYDQAIGTGKDEDRVQLGGGYDVVDVMRWNKEQRSGDLGNQLRLLRGKASIRDAATMLGMNHSTYQRLEQGGAIPTMQDLVAICRVYRITPDELFALVGLWDVPEEPLKEELADRIWNQYRNATRALTKTQQEDFYRVLGMLLRSLSEQAMPVTKTDESQLPRWLQRRREQRDDWNEPTT